MYIYLHGFASGPGSTKARYIQEQFALVGIELQVPDLNQGNFTHLTVSRQITQVVDLFPQNGSPVVLIGSSLGGWISTIIAQAYPQVERLILLAPAFDFLNHWLPKIGDRALISWEQTGYLTIYHHAIKNLSPLHYDFLADARKYPLSEIDRILPTLIIHGTNDEVIPISASHAFAKDRPWVELLEWDSDHQLTNVSDRIWQEICRFCRV
ncbi:YqiA/YcfP family alpha/beta fold hydrolase [Chamaesiphon sp. VAR_48_metabat_135_sub]|uniref:YqiA/YcfP family alpha/beta fold hydrolase n=1 Tax=Chamaesiphon sp. VAR_48_metabat_135_sub TaxID=2964699 RepID=UPI00286C33D5|nr:YqiA/YcfP family alpha/beta fold hydrolase [Chamaesiphon sp. VAR_48_metabat_135_sub]